MSRFLHPSKRFTIGTSLFFVLFVSIVLPLISALTTRLIGVSEAPDTAFFYSVDSLIELMRQYGEDGRRIYIIMRWTFDVAWPIVYTGFFVTTVSYLCNKLSVTGKWIFIPLLGVLFDILENTFITIHMAVFPTELSFLLAITPYMTLFKWIFIGGSLVVQLVLLILLLTNKRHS